MSEFRVAPMSFDNEQFPLPGSGNGYVIYTCSPCPGARIALWMINDNQVTFNLYRTNKTSYGMLTHKEDRAIASQGPVTCENDPLIIQANICHLVNLYSITHGGYE